LRFHVAADYDTAFASWNVDANQDDMRIYSNDSASIHYFRAGGNVELAADLSLATGQGIIHADGVAAGQVLRADGTRYIPDTLDIADITDLAYGTPALTFSTANAAGVASTVMRTDATLAIFDATVPTTIQPDDAAAAGSAGVAARRDHTHAIVAAAPAANSVNVAASAEGVGTSFSRSDHTHNLDESIVPTWTSVHTHQANVVLDDGTGDSPTLTMVGGSNNDTATLFLDDDAVAGNSDFIIRLPAADNDSLLLIQSSTPATMAYIGGGGQVGFGVGPVLVGTSDITRGQIQLYSEGAASTQGGVLLFHVAADYDTTFATWAIDANEDDLRIYSGDAASIHYFRAGGNVEIAGDFNLATGKGIIHADGVTSGYILQADGTRYVPADPAGVLPVAPSARGHILRAEVGPVWASYAASTAGAVLIGDGTDVISDTTPTLVGDLTMDDGTGDSPAVNFVGGTNNDTAKVYLADNATVTDSDLIIQLCDTAGDSVLGIHDSTPAAVLEIDSNGNVELQNDGTWVGRGAGSARIEFNAAGNAISLYSGADLVLYSDAGSTQVGLWDGATGNIVLDDGSGDSPELQFIGGTNNDTIKVFLDDDAGVAGGSDLNVQLADNAGASNFEIWDSTPASVLAIDSDGNIEFRLDDSWIGLGAAAGRFVFDNTPTPDIIRVRNANLVMTTDAGGDILTIRRSGDVSNTEADIYADTRLGLAADSDVYVFIDADNDASANAFVVAKDAENVAGATELMRVSESGTLLPGSAKTQDLGSATLEWDNIYYVTANTGTSRLIESSRVCPVCDAQMSKGTGSLNIRGEDADYELVFCLQCGNAAVEVRNQQTVEMLSQRKPPPQVVLSNVRVNSLGGRDYRVMLDFDYGDGITNSTRLGDDELAALNTMSLRQRKAFIRQLGEREWYAREESRVLQESISEVQATYEPLMSGILGLDLIQ
jgi:hypothetical protein